MKSFCQTSHWDFFNWPQSKKWKMSKNKSSRKSKSFFNFLQCLGNLIFQSFLSSIWVECLTLSQKIKSLQKYNEWGENIHFNDFLRFLKIGDTEMIFNSLIHQFRSMAGIYSTWSIKQTRHQNNWPHIHPHRYIVQAFIAPFIILISHCQTTS